MADQTTIQYIQRALERVRIAAHKASSDETQRITREMSAKGTLQSGGTLRMLAEMHVSTRTEAGRKMARATFDAAGETSEDLASLIEHELTTLKSTLSNNLKERLTRYSGGSLSAVGAAGNIYETEATNILAAVVDDFRHGMSDGARMKSEPSIITNAIVNSPGAALHTGTGNVQTMISTGGELEKLRKAIEDFFADQRVKKLKEEQQGDLRDIAEMVLAEIEKAKPDASRIAKWGRRLLDASVALGVEVAGSGIARILFGV